MSWQQSRSQRFASEFFAALTQRKTIKLKSPRHTWIPHSAFLTLSAIYNGHRVVFWEMWD